VYSTLPDYDIFDLTNNVDAQHKREYKDQAGKLTCFVINGKLCVVTQRQVDLETGWCGSLTQSHFAVS